MRKIGQPNQKSTHRYLIARHRPTKTQPLALSQARKSPHRESRQPLSSFTYPLTQYFNAIIARTTAATPDFKVARIALCSRIISSTDQVVLLKISLYLRYGNIFFDVTRFHNNIEDRHDDISLVNSNRISYLLFPQQRRALCISSASHS